MYRTQVLRADKNRFNLLPQTLALNVSLKDISFADNKIPTVNTTPATKKSACSTLGSP